MPCTCPSWITYSLPVLFSRPFCKSIKVILNSQPFLQCAVVLPSYLPAICMASKDISPFPHFLCVLASMYQYKIRKWEECNFCVSDVGLCVRSRMRWQISSKWQCCSAPFLSLAEMDHTWGNQCIDYWLVLAVLKSTTLLHVTLVKLN